MSEITAQAEAAFAIECASSAAIQGLVIAYGREAVYMAWMLGYLTGAGKATAQALAAYQRPV